MWKTFFLNSFLDVSWMITVSVSITKIAAIKGSISTVSVIIAMTPMVAPRESAPVSPMINLAGGMLNQRKPKVDPQMTPQNAARIKRPFAYAKTASEANAMIVRPPARPSRPSVIFTAFAEATIIKMKSGMYQAPIGKSSIPGI